MLGWIRKVRARRKSTADLGVWFHPDYVIRSLESYAQLVGFNLNRAELITGHLKRSRLLDSRALRLAPMATYHELAAFHDESYLESTENPALLARIFGVSESDIRADEILKSQRRAAGATLAAARAVVAGTLRIGFNLGGGLHHAASSRGSGFCVLNDVAVAIANIRREGFTGKIAVIDLDYHQGDGNVAAFARDPGVFVYSIHGSQWSDEPGPGIQNRLLPPGTPDDVYLEELSRSLTGQLRAFEPRLVFYIAGADVLRGDRFGNFSLTAEGLLARDRQVVELVRALGAGLVITLGGGYSRHAWQASADFLAWLITGDSRHAGRWEEDLRERYDRIAERIDPQLLQATRSNQAGTEQRLNWSEEDLREELKLGAAPDRVLGYYSEQGIEFALERYGVLEKIRKHGHREIEVSVDTQDGEKQLVRVTAQAGLLVELVLKRASIEAPTELKAEPLEFISVEWLLLQDPSAKFTHERPALPGQKHPGLGVAEEIQELLVQAAKRLHLDGVLSHPAHFHNASVPLRHFHFLDPEAEGRFLAIRHVLSRLSLTEASRLLDDGALALGNHTPVSWRSSEHILPVSARMKSHFESQDYTARCLDESRKLLQAGLHVENRPGSPSPIP